MTFDDFLHESQVGYSTIETKEDLHYVIKRTWNAAIEAAQEILSKGEYYWPVHSDYGPDRPDEAEPLAEFAIEALKTK